MTIATLSPATLSPEPHPAQRWKEVQRFGTLRLAPIALGAEARSETAQRLNRIIPDTTILYALHKTHHWLVAGPTFYQLHQLFDKHAGEQLALMDLLPERVQSLGGIAVGDPRHAAELTTIERPPDGAEEMPVMIGACSKRTRRSSASFGRRSQDRAQRRLGQQRHAHERRAAPPRAPGLVPVRAPGRRAPRPRRREGMTPLGVYSRGSSVPRRPICARRTL